MKRLLATCLTMLTCGTAYSLPLGNPSEASLYLNGICWEGGCCDPCDPCFSWCDAWSLRFGFYGDYVFNRHMEVNQRGANDDDIKDVELFTNAGYIALNICDRIDVFTTLGETSLAIGTPGRAFGLPGNEWVDLVFYPDFSWSAGARATIWQCDCFTIGLEGQYFQTRPDADYFVNYANGAVVELDDSSRNHRYHEWQVGLGAAYRFSTSCPTLALVPYAGVTWSWSELEMDEFTFQIGTAPPAIVLRDLETKKLWGWALGMSFTLCDMIGVTVEGRWASEKAIHVNGQFRF